MSEKPTVDEYLTNIENSEFKAYKCSECGAILAPPSGACYSCGGTDMEWTTVSGKGTLVSYTVIHVSPDEFVDEVPYYVAIVKLEEGTSITSRLMGFDPLKPEEELEIGMDLVLDYQKGSSGKTYLAFRKA
ncbi:MAG: Zn-ribbon domain-containing OB-fold protein [Promethearchaeia archaeon]